MAYQIDFTASAYVHRSWRKTILRLLLLAAVLAFVWEVRTVYTTYHEPTLNMRLREYEAVAIPIEEMNAAWDVAAKEYAALARYYRLLWATNPTSILHAAASSETFRLRRAIHPVSWRLKTGGACRIDYRYTFESGDKAKQADGLEAEAIHAVTSAVQVVDGKVDVQGVRHENLLDVNEFAITLQFKLPDVKPFPAKEKVLADCVNEIAAMRKKVQETKFAEKGDAKGVQPTAQALMMAYLAIGRDKPDFPGVANVLNVSGWFDRADRFILKNKIPGDDRERQNLRATWNAIGDARFPWDRFRVLDNEALVSRTKALVSVSDGVRRFKGFLEKRHADCQRKLEPFVEAYARDDVFNAPLIEADLKNRVAAALGIGGVQTAFKDEPGAAAAVLVKADEVFSFTWVRWTLSFGGGGKRDDTRGQTEGVVSDPISIEKIAACVRRVQELGPGYAVDEVNVDFNPDGTISGAVLEGLLPVKKVTSTKERAK